MKALLAEMYRVDRDSEPHLLILRFLSQFWRKPPLLGRVGRLLFYADGEAHASSVAVARN